MKYIFRGKIKINEIITEQEYNKNIQYRWANWSVVKEVDNNEVGLYNLFTRSVAILSKKEYENCFEGEIYKSLIKGYFLVPQDFHERTFYKAFLSAFEKNKPRPHMIEPEAFVILPTTKCNAKCYYCYESKYNKLDMTFETADKVIKYIKKSIKGNRTNILWFGGEPFCNPQIIKYIASNLRKEGIEFVSRTISNGSLFTSIDDIEEIIKVTNLKSAQITLDGTKETYEKIKGVSFENTLSGIDFLLKHKIKVGIRMNLSYDNYEELKKLIYFLKERFGVSDYFVVYVYPLFQLTVEKAGKEIIYDNLIKLTKLAYDLGISFPDYNDVSTHRCMADSGRTTVISPKGELSLCEHHCEGKEIFGSIDKGIKHYNYNIISDWREKELDYPECDQCCYYPQCIRINKCPTSIICTNGYRKFRRFEAEAFIDKKVQDERSRKNRKI